jgi:substrate import-associated zinc metallohydrolase lipoprotein
MLVDWSLTHGKKKIMKQIAYKIIILTLLAVPLLSCEDETLNVPVKTQEPSQDEIDLYIEEHFTNAYGIAVRWKYVDRYVEANKRVTPPSRDVVIPMLDFITEYWIEPFISVPNGEDFFEEHVPAEIVFIGSSIFNDDGTVTLGTADAGARITLTEVNDIDIENKAWVIRQLGTIYHEFAHILHQRYNLPPNWEDISPQGYTSAGSWYTLSDVDALERGFVSPYATSSFNEDFAETAAHILFYESFEETFLTDELCSTSECDARNEGRALIRKKYNAVLSHYKTTVGVDLLKIRELVQAKL